MIDKLKEFYYKHFFHKKSHYILNRVTLSVNDASVSAKI